jgi:hypothetical protein
MLGFAGGLWGAAVIGLIVSGGAESWYNAILTGLNLLFIASIFDRFVLDFAAVTSALNSINKDIADGRWDLICLTHASTREMIRAKYAVAQIRTWRVLTVVIGLRLIVVVFTLLTLFVAPLFVSLPSYYASPYYLVGSLWGAPLDEILLAIMIVPAAFATLGLYIYEPRWRLRALTAASVAVSSQMRQTTLGILAGLGAVFGVWMAQVIMVGAAFALTLFLGSLLWTPVGLGVYLIVQVALIAFMTYHVYDGLAGYWLDRAYERMVRMGSAP